MAAAVFEPAAHPALGDLEAHLRERSGESAYRAGRDYLRKGQVREAAVAGTTAYATVKGSTDYRVTVAFPSVDATKVTCTCPAQRRNKYCKHVVALCSALVEQPASFALVEAPPAPPSAKPARTKRGGAKPAPKASAAAQRATGLGVLDRLMTELAEGGVAQLGAEKVALIEQCAELVRALKLRRLGNLLMQLHRAIGQPDTLDEGTFADLLVELYLCRAATGAQLDEQVSIDPRLAEDLLGKTWRAEELEPVAGLELVEAAFAREDDGEFVVETSYLVDLGSLDVLAERQISPSRKRGQQPKQRHGARLVVDDAGLYPGLPPRRVRLNRVRQEPLRDEDVRRLLERVPSDVEEVRRRVVERAATPFGEADVPILFRPAALLLAPPTAEEKPTRGRRTPARRGASKRSHAASQAAPAGAIDARGQFIRLGWSGAWADDVASLWRDDRPVALFGLASLDDAGIRLDCLAVLGASPPPSVSWGYWRREARA